MLKRSAIIACNLHCLLVFLSSFPIGTIRAARHVSLSTPLTPSQIVSSQEQTLTDESIATSTRSVLKSMNIDVLRIEIVHDRTHHGERVMIINCAHCSGSEGDHLRELVKILQSGDAVNKSYQTRIDLVTVVVGNRQGRVCAIITVRSSDAEQYMQNKNIYTYLKAWTVAIFEPDFLPQTAALMDW